MWFESFQLACEEAKEKNREKMKLHIQTPFDTESTSAKFVPNDTVNLPVAALIADHRMQSLCEDDAGGQENGEKVDESHGENGIDLATCSDIDGSHSQHGNDVVTQSESTWSMDKERILLGPYDYATQQPGKDIRGRFIAAFNAWLSVPSEKLSIILKVVSMLHTASLMVDDIEDNSELRRGAPVAHSIFGHAQTINSANYVYVLALKEVTRLNNSAAVNVYTEELLNLHRGQGMELFWRDSLRCPSEEDYIEMVGNKTGGLFRLAVRLMQAESDAKKNYVPIASSIGIIFQICDDYLNLCNTTYIKTKGLCEDLTEGKFSFPVIHSVRSKHDSHLLMNVLRQKTKDESVKQYAVRYMQDTGSFLYTQKVVLELYEKATKMIDDLDWEDGNGHGRAVRNILSKIVEATLSDHLCE